MRIVPSKLGAATAYVRVPNEARRQQEKAKYKKGWEVRLVFVNPDQLQEARKRLNQQGFHAGSPFRKSRRLILPIYGRAAVEAYRPTGELND